MELYSRKIVGYSLSRSLSIEGSIEVLERAFGTLGDVIVKLHHSDMGVQYCSK